MSLESKNNHVEFMESWVKKKSEFDSRGLTNLSYGYIEIQISQIPVEFFLSQ